MRIALAALARLVTALPLLAVGPENVLVVVNQRSAESRDIGQHYMRRRAIRAGNVCLIRATPEETVDRAAYEREVETPVRTCLDKRAPADPPVQVIVTTLGVPLRVTGTDGLTSTAASVDSELSILYIKRQGRKPPLEGSWPNPFFGKVHARFDQRAFPLYMTARLAAYDVATVKRMIDKGMEATNRGRFVVDLQGPANEKEADWWLAAAVAPLPKGRVVIDPDVAVLYDVRDVVAYASWGSNDKRRKRRLSGFHFVPGALVTEYVSSNGRTLKRPPRDWTFGDWDTPSTHYAKSPQSLAADYLDEGATAATGHTWEPYLNHTPRPDMLFPAYYSGRTLVESYFIALPALSWMNVLFGDPLCTLGPPPK